MKTPTAAGDRRPIASRDTALAQRIAAWLIARSVRPNAISCIGMIAGMLAGALLAATASFPGTARALWLSAALLVQLRLLCNMFDGMVAVGSGRASPTGEIYNEVPDRVADSVILIGLGYASGGQPWLGFLAALLAMFTAYVRAVGRAAGAGSDFRGPMGKQQRMFMVTLTALYLGLAPTTWRPQSPGIELPTLCLCIIAAGAAATGVRRLLGIIRRLRDA